MRTLTLFLALLASLLSQAQDVTYVKDMIDGDWKRLTNGSIVTIKGSADKDLTESDLINLDAGRTVSKIYDTPRWLIVYTLEYPFIVNQVTRTQRVYVMANNEVVDAMDMGAHEIPPTTTTRPYAFFLPLVLLVFIVFSGTNEATSSIKEALPNFIFMFVVLLLGHSYTSNLLMTLWSWMIPLVLLIFVGMMIGFSSLGGMKDYWARMIMGGCLSAISFVNGIMTVHGFWILFVWFIVACSATLIIKHLYNRKRLATEPA